MMPELRKSKSKKEVDNYAFVTDDMFDQKLVQCMRRHSMESILQIEGVAAQGLDAIEQALAPLRAQGVKVDVLPIDTLIG